MAGIGLVIKMRTKRYTGKNGRYFNLSKMEIARRKDLFKKAKEGNEKAILELKLQYNLRVMPVEKRI